MRGRQGSCLVPGANSILGVPVDISDRHEEGRRGDVDDRGVRAGSAATPKALRMYDGLGLLSPAAVDAESGYRYYHPDQLERARFVALLRRVGLALARIRAIVDLPPAAAAERSRPTGPRSRRTWQPGATSRPSSSTCCPEGKNHVGTSFCAMRPASMRAWGAKKTTISRTRGPPLLAVADGIRATPGWVRRPSARSRPTTTSTSATSRRWPPRPTGRSRSWRVKR